MTTATGFEVLAAIDLQGGRVVRLRQGDFDRSTAYGDDPIAVAERFVVAGARWLHVVDLDAARDGVGANRPIIDALVAAVAERARVEIAGGLRDEAAVAAVLQMGAARAVIGTAALTESAFAGRLVATHGAEFIAAAIDVRDGRALGHGWSKGAAGVDATDAIECLAAVGITTFEVTAIERDGLLEGPDLPLYERVVRLERGSVIASGGIATLDDLRAIRDLGCAGAIVGRALYEGQIELTDALAVATEPT
jgi:phosphoribosylformimino-5-aminoimidazole carboxamide ribotide isomerase